MKFLDQIFLDNTIRSYLVVATVIIVALIIKRILTKYATSLIFRMGKSKWSGITKKEFDNFIVTPLERIFMLLIIILALDQIRFPNALLFSIHHKVTSRDVVDAFTSAVVIICIVSLLIRFIDYLVLVVQNKGSENQTAGRRQLLLFFKDLIRVIIIIFGIIFILKYSFNLDIGNLLTGLSILGAAIALAAKESLENFIASFIVFFDKPFETGDYIKVGDIAGTVEHIGLRSTRVRTVDNSLVTIPNKQMVDSVLDNWSERSSLRNVLTTQLSPATSSENLQKAVKGIENILASKKEKIVSYEVHLQEITATSATIVSTYFVPKEMPYNDMMQFLQEIQIEIRKMQEGYGIQAADSGKVTVVNRATPPPSSSQ